MRFKETADRAFCFLSSFFILKNIKIKFDFASHFKLVRCNFYAVSAHTSMYIANSIANNIWPFQSNLLLLQYFHK